MRLPFGNPTMIYYKGTRRYFINNNEVKPFNIQLWGQYGMTCLSDGPILDFVCKNCPENTAIICYQADYNFVLPEELVKLYPRILQINRYTDVPNGIVIPGDDKFFIDPSAYLPAVYIPFDERINKAFWRGSCTANHRKDVILKLIKNPNADVKLLPEASYKYPYWQELPKEYFTTRCSPDEFSKYKIWISVEGWGCASDTTRALMSGCAVIYYRKTKPWFNHYLKHEENCIIIENDLEMLNFYVTKLTSDIELTRKIASNGKELSGKIFQEDVYKKYILDQLNAQ